MSKSIVKNIYVERIATLEADLEAMQRDYAEVSKELTEAIDIIRMTGVAPKFVEKHQ